MFFQFVVKQFSRRMGSKYFWMKLERGFIKGIYHTSSERWRNFALRSLLFSFGGIPLLTLRTNLSSVESWASNVYLEANNHFGSILDFSFATVDRESFPQFLDNGYQDQIYPIQQHFRYFFTGSIRDEIFVLLD